MTNSFLCNSMRKFANGLRNVGEVINQTENIREYSGQCNRKRFSKGYGK